MSDELKTKNKNNLNPTDLIDFRSGKKIKFPKDFIDKAEVHSILSSNFGKISTDWFKFISIWNYNAYQTFNDMDKYFIMTHLIQKSLEHYGDLFLIYSEDEFYSRQEFQIEKINLTEISSNLNIPKETVRRKINQMIERNILSRDNKKILLTLSAFEHKKPKNSIKGMSNFLSTCSKYLATEDWFERPVANKEIEEFTRTNFTLVWKFFLRFMIPYLIRQRKFYGDLETFFVAGTVYVNHIQRLRDKNSSNPLLMLSEEGDSNSAETSYLKWTEYLTSNNEKILGINASSVSEITGIPRATAIRKLKNLEKSGLIMKDKKQLYKTGTNIKKHVKELEKQFVENQLQLNKFVSTFFELFYNSNLSAVKIDK